jgi:hypothetical protein
VFLGDGDAMALSTRRLMAVLEAIRTHLPGVRRISSYCLPRNVRSKSVADLTALREAGLSLAYVGAESGDDEVLRKVNKGETFDSTARRAGQAGRGRHHALGDAAQRPGRAHAVTRQHAENSARLANATQPEFLATLVVSFPQGEARFRANFPNGSRWTCPRCSARWSSCCRRWNCGARCSAATMPPTGWCSRARWARRRTRLLAQVRTAIAAPQNAPLRPGLDARPVVAAVSASVFVNGHGVNSVRVCIIRRSGAGSRSGSTGFTLLTLGWHGGRRVPVVGLDDLGFWWIFKVLGGHDLNAILTEHVLNVGV